MNLKLRDVGKGFLRSGTPFANQHGAIKKRDCLDEVAPMYPE
jgi:hypothetical protein